MSALVHHPDTHRLGKHDPRPPRAMLRELVDVERLSPQVPDNVVNSFAGAARIPLAMYLNDREGDCTCAGAANTLRVNSRGHVLLSEADVQAAYVALTGREGAAFDPRTGANDNGCVELDVLDHWTRVGIGGDRLRGHAGVDMSNPDEVRTALYLCGSVYPGLQLSTDAQAQRVWQPGRAAPGSWGGHCAVLFDWWRRSPAGLLIGGVEIPAGSEVLDFGTWGDYKPALPDFLPFSADEGHALITDAWLAANEGNPAIDFQALSAYLRTLRPES